MNVLKILTHKPVVFASMVLSIVFVICGRTRKETSKPEHEWLSEQERGSSTFFEEEKV